MKLSPMKSRISPNSSAFSDGRKRAVLRTMNKESP
jgi:hypothetical protein